MDDPEGRQFLHSLWSFLTLSSTRGRSLYSALDAPVVQPRARREDDEGHSQFEEVEVEVD
jgi:hypothetical protein